MKKLFFLFIVLGLSVFYKASSGDQDFSCPAGEEVAICSGQFCCISKKF